MINFIGGDKYEEGRIKKIKYMPLTSKSLRNTLSFQPIEGKKSCPLRKGLRKN